MSDSLVIAVDTNLGYPKLCADCGALITAAAMHFCRGDLMQLDIEGGLLVFETGGNVSLSDGIPGPGDKLDIFPQPAGEDTAYTDEERAMILAIFSGECDGMTVREMRELVQGGQAK